MREGKYFERELPAGYRRVKTIDAKDKKVGLILNLIAWIPLLITLIGAYFATGKPSLIPDLKDLVPYLLSLLVLAICITLQLFLHELLHGAVYKFFTREKLTFGLTLTVAFCGVPKIYVYRKPAIAATLAPFVAFLPIYLILCFLLPTPILKLFASFLLGLHIGGCVGDLWVSGLLIFKFRDDRTLINDTGPKQTFYLPDGSDDK